MVKLMNSRIINVNSWDTDLWDIKFIKLHSLKRPTPWPKSYIWLEFIFIRSDSRQRNDQMMQICPHFSVTFLIPSAKLSVGQNIQFRNLRPLRRWKSIWKEIVVVSLGVLCRNLPSRDWAEDWNRDFRNYEAKVPSSLQNIRPELYSRGPGFETRPV